MSKRRLLFITATWIMGIVFLACLTGCDIVEDSESEGDSGGNSSGGGGTLTIKNLKDVAVTVIIVKDDGSSMYVREWKPVMEVSVGSNSTKDVHLSNGEYGVTHKVGQQQGDWDMFSIPPGATLTIY